MSIGEKILEYRKEHKVSQEEFAQELHVDRSLISKIESGKLGLPEHHEPNIAKMNWKLTLSIIQERSGGYITNLLEDIPNLDLNPASLKEILLQQLDELEEALEDIRMAKHIPIEKRKRQAERVWMETKDVLDYTAIMLGVIEEEFQLDIKRLRSVHKMEIKRGER